MIRIENLCKSVDTSEGLLTILKSVSLDIDTGEAVAIVGASGSGKSTLLGLMAGLDTATSGDVVLDGQSLNAMDEEQRAVLRGRLVGFVFQSFQLLPSLTALENVMLPIELKGDAQAHEKAKRLLARVGLDDRGHHYPNQLSGGEQQRVAIARAFATEARILFADEPTGNLDSKSGAEILNLFDELHDQGKTLIMVTHSDEMAERSQRLVRLRDGLVESDDRRNA